MPVVIAGDSAGGNFAAAISILARDRAGPKLSLQVLLYPVVSYESEETGYSDSFKQNREGYYLTVDKFEWYLKQYLSNPEQALDPRFSVTQTKDLSNLPAAVIVTVEFDILKDQGKAYAEKLQAAGVPVQSKDYPGQIHSFLGFAVTQYGTDAGVQALADVGQLIRKHFESST